MVKYRFVSEEQFNAWAKQNYAQEFVFAFDSWDTIFEMEDIEYEMMIDTIEINGEVYCSTRWYPFNTDDIGTRIIEVEE
ncbi:hypothetical protein IPAKJDPM_00117 [Aeromonas phage avDM14-QBC]|nr:hypothetical protein IPAKJDPM_00117 [Aeromonas phage avDM14-QBC]UYD58676.1 hypothetical protein HNNIDBEH_00083 [Aeromonas phage avDM10-HWA]UYD59021.1 hypothetical protein OFOPOMKI_00171 [Aeromonas phage avDM7-IJDJ]